MDQNTIKRRKLGLIDRDIEKMRPGYILYALQTGGGIVDLIDKNGRKVHKWNMPVRPGRDAVILPWNGNLGYSGSHEKSVNLYPAWDIWHGGHFFEVTPEGKIVWEFEDPYHHHDSVWLENGNILYAAAQRIPGNEEVIGDVVKEVNRKGELVWEWKSWERLNMEKFKNHENFPQDHYPMINGLSLTKKGNVLMSLRNTSGIICVDRHVNNGCVIWDFPYPNVAQQHCPSQLDNENILCFDNGNIRPNSLVHSRIVEFVPITKKIVWTYTDPMPSAFFSPYMGSVERLGNGNNLICESAYGRIFEITKNKETVWEYVIPDFAEYPEPLNSFITGSHNSCFKAHHYDSINWL